MNNYDVYNPYWFDTDINEIEKLKDKTTYLPEEYQEDLSKLKNHFRETEIDIINFKLKKIPRQMKRNTWDIAVLLCVHLSDGTYKAKRHNNSQWLSIRY